MKTEFAKPLNSQKSFEELADLTLLSSQTLRRFFGKIEQHNRTSTTTLSLLSRFVGYQDWNQFLQYHTNEKSISVKDKTAIENMAVFFTNGEKYNTDYFQKTITVDTLNDYARVIYAKQENVQYFYQLYCKNNWATDYILSWIPNYNYYGKRWFREILQDKMLRTEKAHVRLAQGNFIHFGAWLSEDRDFDYTASYDRLKIFYKAYKKEFDYMPYHEMRFCTISLIEAKRNGKPVEKTVATYLKTLREKGFSAEGNLELLTFYCNTLFWLQEYEIAYQIIQEIKPTYNNFQNDDAKDFLHYFGVNRAFVKITFALVYLANDNLDVGDFELQHGDFNDEADFLFHDYMQVMYLVQCILYENGLQNKKKLFADLKSGIELTHYTRIYRILEELDPVYSQYAF
ncbi:MAG: hypothetical protein Q4F57_05560 [Weeksellaceae bacterium]|nr:hypothetical protein [Weeksellaceae bacterium]